MLLATAVSHATPARADESLPRGIVIPRVALRSDPAQSYALYLPPSYERARRWTAILCFDPGGLGAVPVERLRETAEANNLLLIGFNSVRSGQLEEALRSAEAAWSDVVLRLNVDPDRLYLAGFSAGATIALEFARGARPAIAGVLACSGTQKDPPEKKAAALTPIALLTGTGDWALPAIESYAADLRALGTVHRIFVAKADNEWPAPAALRDAWEWLALVNSRSGRIPLEAGAVRRIARRGLIRAAGLEADQRWIEAREAYLALVALVPGSEEGRTAEQAAERLARLPQYKAARQREARQRERETEFVDRVVAVIDELGARPTDANTRRRAIAELGIEIWRQEQGDIGMRALNRAFVESYSRGFDGLLRGRIPVALIGLGVAAAIRPHSPLALYNYACALARHGERQEALKFLTRAVDTGRFSAEQLLQDEDLASLRNTAEFKRLVRPKL